MHEELLTKIANLNGEEIAAKVATAIDEHSSHLVERADGSKERRHPRVIGSESFAITCDENGLKAHVTLLAVPDYSSEEDDPAPRKTRIDVDL